MKSLRFDAIQKLSSILYEFIPLYVAFNELNNLMKDIRPFIPESITRQSDEEVLDLDEEERRNKQMIEMRKKLMPIAKKIAAQQKPITKVITVQKSKSRVDLNTLKPNINEQKTNEQKPVESITPQQKPQQQTPMASSLLDPNLEERPNSAVDKLRNAVSKAVAKATKPRIEGSLSLQINVNLHDNMSEVSSVFNSSREFGSNLGSGFSPEFKKNFGLGLTSHITTIIIIQFRNFDGKSYPNTADLLSVFTLLFQKVQSVSRQFRGRTAIITPKVLMISFEVGKNAERNALLCALQLEKQMQSVNTQLTEQVNLPPVEFGIGVSRSECLVGNIGTAAVRYSALIGACSSNALRLAALCAYFGTSILTDESLTLALNIGFITRAVHFMHKKSILDEKLCLDDDDVNKQTIFQLLGERKILDDEWFYEIQQQEQNNLYKEFDQAFELLRGDVNMTLLKEICGVFEAYSSKHPTDKVVSLLYAQLSKYLQYDAEEVVEAIRAFSLEKTDIPLHTDPSFIL
ncbi:predicted protein [Naegleria gruberi]|uniref:Predicted protein n=1 Tax=Naegleria gruberi TaxID=5762 RepID=D2VCR5_NAEGR|nr:uncharacterized protein NAEGRDRAFT_66666 [Naegleria gruberi]EFC45355.1 predicted protein [Naegleria gruberi]|eukprot:XP_002678099.1 predicted protein [Naegleria gruberi strain NEG-M]